MEITVNTNLADGIVKVVNDLCAKLGIVFDWTAENVWPKLQELMDKFINYKIALDWFGIIAPFVLLIAFIILAVIAHKRDWDEDLCIFFDIMIGVTAVAAIIVAICSAVSLFRCYNFPEFEIYKYLANKGVI